MNAEYGIRNVFLLIVLGLASFVFSRALLFRFSCESIRSPENNQATNHYFVDKQVIVTGPRDEVSNIVAPLQLNLIEDCDLGYLNTRNAQNPDRTQSQRSFIQALRQPLVMQLYEIPADQTLTVEDAIAAIQVGNIVADPNYLTSLSDSASDPCGRPSEGGSGGGHPFGDPGVPDPKTDEARKAREAFMNQWAFGSQGIDLPTSSRFAGHDVRVGVFDTSPFRNTRGSVRIAIAQPSPLTLTTIDALANENIASIQGKDEGNHGLFVAGLVHAVAPKSKIQLVRVLNDDGCGQLWILNKALEGFTSRMSAWTGNLNRTVINMSLGIRMPDMSQPDDLKTLRSAITHADDLGAIIVAAAGNDSPGKDKNGNTVDPMPMQVPAEYANVIGVAATNNEGKRSCYSNAGDVSAPGGDGSTNPCVSRADSWNRPPGPNGGSECTDLANCPYILISLAQTDNGPQYIYWSGTSFAAPLFSGLVALAYEEGEKSQVECLIRRGASPLVGATTSDPNNWGIINVTQSLSSDVLSTCGVRP